jgi:hypothetical protein
MLFAVPAQNTTLKSAKRNRQGGAAVITIAITDLAIAVIAISSAWRKKMSKKTTPDGKNIALEIPFKFRRRRDSWPVSLGKLG